MPEARGRDTTSGGMRNLWLVWVWIAALFVWNVSARAQNLEDPRDPYYQFLEVERGTPEVSIEPASNPVIPIQSDWTLQTISATTVGPIEESAELSPSASMAPNAAVLNPYLIAKLLLMAWDIVLEGKPVVNVEVKNANALPVMADYNWSRLTGWRPERVVKWPLRIKNLWGQTPVRMETAVKLLYGGSIQGRGMYIASARVVPSGVEVWNGYDLDVSVKVPSVINVSGRDDDPIAQITLEILYKIRSRLGKLTVKKSEWTEVFKVQGDGYFLDYKHGKEHFPAEYHRPAPPLPSPTPVEFGDPTSSEPRDDVWGGGSRD